MSVCASVCLFSAKVQVDFASVGSERGGIGCFRVLKICRGRRAGLYGRERGLAYGAWGVREAAGGRARGRDSEKSEKSEWGT